MVWLFVAGVYSYLIEHIFMMTLTDKILNAFDG